MLLACLSIIKVQKAFKKWPLFKKLKFEKLFYDWFVLSLTSSEKYPIWAELGLLANSIVYCIPRSHPMSLTNFEIILIAMLKYLKLKLLLTCLEVRKSWKRSNCPSMEKKLRLSTRLSFWDLHLIGFSIGKLM